jgi:hypothetical protein
MAHYAQLDENNVVTQVIVVSNDVLIDNGVERGELGVQFCESHFGGKWVQTSYNGNFRGPTKRLRSSQLWLQAISTRPMTCCRLSMRQGRPRRRSRSQALSAHRSRQAQELPSPRLLARSQLQLLVEAVAAMSLAQPLQRTTRWLDSTARLAN